MLTKNIGIQIKQKRISQNLTLEGLAEVSDTSVSFISRIERHATESVSLAKLLDVLDVLGMAPSEVFGAPSLDDAESSLWATLRSLPDDDRHRKVAAVLELLK